MRLLIFLVISTILCSCSTTSKISYLSQKKLENDFISVTRDQAVPFEIKDCAVGVIIFPVNTLINFDQELEKQCGERWELFDLEQKESKFAIPLIYSQYCKTVRGLCKK